MSFSFPTSPTTGQQYAPTGGPTYTWNGTAWQVLTPGQQFAEQQFTATAGQTTFTVAGGYVIGGIDVYRNGVKLLVGSDFTATDLSTVVLTNACSAGDMVEVIKLAQILYADALKATNNLSDVGNAATARANLGAVGKAGDTMTGVYGFNAYLRIGKGLNNNDCLAFNYTPDNVGNYTPIWSGDASGGGSIIHMPSGGNAGLDFLYRQHGTNSSSVTISSFSKAFGFDNNGRVTMPNQPGFYASNFGSVPSSNGAWKFGYIQHNVGNCYNNTTGRFTAPSSGQYVFNASDFGNLYRAISFSVNGSMKAESYVGSLNGNSAQITCVIYLTAGDYVTVNYSSEPSPLPTGGGVYFRFTGYLLG